MPISKKIIDKINELNLDEDLKDSMIRLLEKEDEGIHRYKAFYDEILNDYISKKEEIENHD